MPAPLRPDGQLRQRQRPGAAVRAGLGWGMYPEQLIDTPFAPITDQHLDVPLYWQCWKLNSATVTQVTEAVRAAATGLRRGR